MGSFIFDEINDFSKQQTAFAVHPKPLEINSLNNLQKRYVFPFISPAEHYKIKHGGENMVIALLDTGVYTEHVALNNKVIESIMFDGSPNGNGKTSDEHGHGTHLAGILVASPSTITYTVDGTQNVKSYAGMLPEAHLVSIRVTSDKSGSTSWFAIAEGLEQVLKYNSRPSLKNTDKIKVVVLAYNAFENVISDLPICNHRINKLIQELFAKKVAVVISAGNGYNHFQATNKLNIASGLSYPAYCKNALVAMAMDEQNNLADFSQRRCDEDHNFSNYVYSAFGTDTLSTGISSPTSASVLSGSSQAAAVLAGIYIQQLSKMPGNVNDLHTIEVINALKQRAANTSQNMQDASRRNHVKHFNIAKL